MAKQILADDKNLDAWDHCMSGPLWKSIESMWGFHHSPDGQKRMLKIITQTALAAKISMGKVAMTKTQILKDAFSALNIATIAVQAVQGKHNMTHKH